MSAKNSTTKVGAGDIEIVLGSEGNEHTCYLVPTIGAAQGISRAFGGLRGALNMVSNLDLDVIARVIQFGLGPRAVKDLGGADKLNDLVWKSGFTDSTGALVVKCIEYISVLSNGGRPIESKSGGDNDEDDTENQTRPH